MKTVIYGIFNTGERRNVNQQHYLYHRKKEFILIVERHLWPRGVEKQAGIIAFERTNGGGISYISEVPYAYLVIKRKKYHQSLPSHLRQQLGYNSVDRKNRFRALNFKQNWIVNIFFLVLM